MVPWWWLSIAALAGSTLGAMAVALTGLAGSRRSVEHLMAEYAADLEDVTGEVVDIGTAQQRTERRILGPRCLCSHGLTVHDHHRAGTDCGICGPIVCPGFRRAG